MYATHASSVFLCCNSDSNFWSRGSVTVAGVGVSDALERFMEFTRKGLEKVLVLVVVVEGNLNGGEGW